MRVAVLCAFLSVCALTYSQLPPPCAVPNTFSADILQFDRRRTFFSDGKMFYDANEQRIAYFLIVETQRETILVEQLLLFKEGVIYTVTNASDECVKNETEGDFRRIQIPANATFIKEFYIGSSSSPEEGVLVELWFGKTENPAGTYDILVTVDGCDPINDVFYDEESNDIFETYFQNVVHGITDPDVFIPPDKCR